MNFVTQIANEDGLVQLRLSDSEPTLLALVTLAEDIEPAAIRELARHLIELAGPDSRERNPYPALRIVPPRAPQAANEVQRWEPTS